MTAIGYDPNALEHAFQAHRGRPIHSPAALPPVTKLTATRRRPALLPTAVFLTKLGKNSLLQTLPAGLAPPVGTVLVLPHTQRLRITSVALAVGAAHPAQRETSGTFYIIQCEPYTR